MAKRPIVTPALKRLAAQLEASAGKAFLRACAALQKSVPVEAIIAALERGEVTAEILAALAEFPKRLEPLGRVIAYGYQAGGEASAATLSRVLRVSFGFDMANPRAVAWAATHTGKLIAGIKEGTLDGVRTIMTEAMAGAVNPRVTARELYPLVKRSLGLTEQQAGALAKYRHELVKAGRSADDIARLAERYSDKLLRHRSRTIARTESITSLNQGQHEAWLQAESEGLLDAADTVRVWITAPDEKRCDICAGLEGKEAGLNGPFISDDIGEVMMPPAHVACRCSAGIVAA